MEKNLITDIQTAPHYTWGDDCDSWVLADTPSLSVKQEAVPPGAKEVPHFHSVAQQFFFVLKGTASFYTDGQKQALKQGQGLLVPPTAKHFIANESKEPLSFLVVSQPSTESDRTNSEESFK